MFKTIKIAAIIAAIVSLTGCSATLGSRQDMADVGISTVVGTAAGAVFGALACGRGNPDCVRQMAAAGMATGAAVGIADVQNQRAMQMAQQPVNSMYCERAFDARSNQWVLVNCRQAVAQTTIGTGVPNWVPR